MAATTKNSTSTYFGMGHMCKKPNAEQHKHCQDQPRR